MFLCTPEQNRGNYRKCGSIDLSGERSLARWSAPLLLLLVFIFWDCILPPAYPADPTVPALLKQARAEKDPALRIRLLDDALKMGTTRKDILATIYFERGMAHKEMKDCYRAIEDFSLSSAQSSGRIQPLLEKAHCLILVDQLDEAARALDRAILIDPTRSQIYVLKGMLYEKDAQLSRAADEYTRALHYEPGSHVALDLRAQVLSKQGKPKEALEDLKALNRMDPDRPDVLANRARVYMKLKEYGKALEDYERTETLTQGDAAILKEKVQLFFNTDRPALALNTLSRYLAAKPDDMDAVGLQARAHILMGKYDEADKILERVTAKNPSFAHGHLYSGMVAMRRKQWDKALADLNLAINLAPSLVEAYKERAKAFIALGEPVRAASDLTTAAELDPSDGEIFAMRALTLMNRMLYDAAINDFTRALECTPGDPRVLYDRAVAYAYKDEWLSALTDLDTLLAKDPAKARALSLRGVAHFNRGDFPKARADLDRATTHGASDPVVWNNRGFFRYKMGDHKGAVQDFNRALQLDRDYAEARYNLGLVLRKQEEHLRTPVEPSHGRERMSGKPAASVDR